MDPTPLGANGSGQTIDPDNCIMPSFAAYLLMPTFVMPRHRRPNLHDVGGAGAAKAA